MRDFNMNEDRLWRSLMRLNGTLPRLLDEDLRASGLTLSEFAILLVLSEGEDGRRRMGDLANAAGLSPSRTTRVVADLERRGYADRTRDETDARSAVAKVTKQGRAVVARAYPVQVDRARSVLFDHLTAEQVEELAGVLESFLRRVQSERPGS
ncbi:MarR family transcriptional regulator [Diaminobutyricibacter tongyongensis]|uniref:MarR family transcriptional regulator n=1 Tax=Leifsonia tongyongensis TaxID=1268043 RepID=A0A6L9XWC2_9MICO|nr:MarR family transcriptional regulator [Diaminobutyricibacter tongyongensis]